MFQIVISGRWFKNDWYFKRFNSRVKKTFVWFYDYDEVVWFIINHLSSSELEKLRLNIYQKYHYQIKFTNFCWYDINWGFYEWIELNSPIIDISYSEFAELLPSQKLKKQYFMYDDIREKYVIDSQFINYVKLKCPLM